MSSKWSTERQDALIVTLTNRITGKSFRAVSQAPNTIARLSDGIVTADEVRLANMTGEQASRLISHLQDLELTIH